MFRMLMGTTYIYQDGNNVFFLSVYQFCRAVVVDNQSVRYILFLTNEDGKSNQNENPGNLFEIAGVLLKTDQSLIVG
jgi:hypothetical protein